MTKALVTGATGFIGRNLVRRLVVQGHEVTCLARETSNRAPLEPLGVEFAVADMTDPKSLVAPIAKVDVVYHLAAVLKVPWRKTFVTDNAAGAANVSAACAAAARPPVLVVVSSMAACGVPTGSDPRREDEVPAPVSRYGAAKLAAEQAAAEYADRVPTTIVRPPMVFGPGDRSTFKLFRMASRGRFFTPTRRVSRMSLISVTDLARLLILVAERGERLRANDDSPGRGIYFAAARETPTLPELGQQIAGALGRDSLNIWRAPSALTYAVASVGEAIGRLRDRPTVLSIDKAREACAGSWVCDTAKVQDLGFTAEPLPGRLAEAAAWYRQEGWL